MKVNKIIFYRNKKGQEPVYDYLKELSRKKDKDSRVKLTKIQDYINVREINQAEKELDDFKKRSGIDE